jgi:hypothetical protein
MKNLPHHTDHFIAAKGNMLKLDWLIGLVKHAI